MDWSSNREDMASTGENLALMIGGSALALTALASPFLIVPAIYRIPWMVTPKRVIVKALDKVGEGRGKSFIDLGSGDGRLVIESAKRGYTSIGFELNPVLVTTSIVSARLAGVNRSTSFRSRDFWQSSLEAADVVSCFGIAPVMDRLSKKMVIEAKPGTKLVCFRFRPKLPPRELVLVYGNPKEELFIYEVRRKGGN